jgi:hypothetical protein
VGDPGPGVQGGLLYARKGGRSARNRESA